MLATFAVYGRPLTKLLPFHFLFTQMSPFGINLRYTLVSCPRFLVMFHVYRGFFRFDFSFEFLDFVIIDSCLCQALSFSRSLSFARSLYSKYSLLYLIMCRVKRAHHQMQTRTHTFHTHTRLVSQHFIWFNVKFISPARN